jgi:hypothetical protein
VKIAGVLIAAVLLAFASPAAARIVVLDPSSGAVLAEPVGDNATELLRWTDDGTALIGERDEHVVRVDVATGAVTPQPALDDVWAIGPGGRTVVVDRFARNLRITVRDPDGRGLGAQVLGVPPRSTTGAWSRDGTRVAFAIWDDLLVFDATTGQLVLHTTVPWVTVDAQAFASDNSALVVASGSRVLRVELPSGAQSEVLRAGRRDYPHAVWGANGSVAVTVDDGARIRVLGPTPADLRPDDWGDDVRWSPDGSTLSYIVLRGAGRRCEPDVRDGLSVVIPGTAPRPLLPLGDWAITRAVWSPVGGTIAVQLEGDGHVDVVRRGKRHPWPKRISRTYGMFSRRGDAAVRRIVVRAASALRGGASRGLALSIVSDGYERVSKRYREASDSAVAEVLAVEVSKWLRAAGWREIDGLDEMEC